jgi:hypothetical protein
LCNRMREIASSLALAQATGQSLVVYWLKNRYLNCSFEGLFEPIEGVRVVDVETGRARALFSADSLRYRFKVLREPIDLFLGNSQVEQYRAAGVDIVPLVAKAKRCVIITYYSLLETAPYLGAFRPRSDILARVEKTVAQLEVDGRVGVHIRGTDNAEALEGSPLELFLERMRCEVDRDPKVRFFLATDDPVTEHAVKGRFPGRVVSIQKVFARDKAAGVRDALVDLLVLSRCRSILGSHWSTFTNMAADLGGLQVEIVGGASALSGMREVDLGEEER